MPAQFFSTSRTHTARAIALRQPSVFLLLCSLCVPLAANAQAASSNESTWTVAIVLPPRIVAEAPTTLAVLDVNGRLAAGVNVDLGRDQRVTTDSTGRATFTAPAEGDILIAKASGSSAAALIDLPPSERPQQRTLSHGDADAGPSVSPTVSLRDYFPICAPGLQGNADANHVTLNGQRALVLAASPECIVVLPGPYSLVGPAKIEIAAASKQLEAKTTLVSLEFAAPQPPLVPGKKSVLTVEARGSEQPLRVIVENETPGVLRFRRGETQELFTKGGTNNSAVMEVEARRSGDFSFHARPLPAPDADIGRRYLRAAAQFSPKNLQHEMLRFADRLAHHPNDLEKIRGELQDILDTTIPGDFRTLLSAACSSL